MVVSLSSMIYDRPEHLTQVFLEAIQRTGCRAIIQAGWTGLANDTKLPDAVYQTTKFVPHSWLFPRASCVIHHGGAGTTIAALRAGIPSVTIPHAFDQFALSQRLLDLGCASSCFLSRS